MDQKLETYRAHIKRILREYAAIKPSYGDVEVEAIEDDAAGHYALWHIGWDRGKRIHQCLLHVDLKGGKIWIQHDGLPEGIATDLMEAGVPSNEMVLAFHPPSERRLTPFAVG